MIPTGVYTVTLFRRSEEKVGGRTAVTYERETLTGCTWRRRRSLTRAGETLLPVEEVICRVPAGQAEPKPGDLMILGDVEETVASSADFQRLKEQYADTGGAFVAASVRRNVLPGMPVPHWAVRG